MPKNNTTRFFYVLYIDQTWVFHQYERVQGAIYNKNLHGMGVHNISAALSSLEQQHVPFLARRILPSRWASC